MPLLGQQDPSDSYLEKLRVSAIKIREMPCFKGFLIEEEVIQFGETIAYVPYCLRQTFQDEARDIISRDVILVATSEVKLTEYIMALGREREQRVPACATCKLLGDKCINFIRVVSDKWTKAEIIDAVSKAKKNMAGRYGLYLKRYLVDKSGTEKKPEPKTLEIHADVKLPYPQPVVDDIEEDGFPF